MNQLTLDLIKLIDAWRRPTHGTGDYTNGLEDGYSACADALEELVEHYEECAV